MSLTRLDRQYGRAVRGVWASVLGRVGRSWTDLRSWRDADAARFQRQALPIILAGERQVATLTATYQERLYREVEPHADAVTLDLDEVTGTALRGVDPEDVYQRPFKEVWTALSNDVPLDDAVTRGANRLETLVKTDLQLSRTHTVQALAPQLPKFEYTIRVLQGEYDCALCMIASTQRYRKRDLAPIHPGCDCLIKLVTADEDPGQVIDEDKLDAIHRAVDSALGTHDRGGRAVDYRQILISNEHGEIGPVLSFRGQKFTGPDDVQSTENSDSTSPEHVIPEPVAGISDATRQRIADVREQLPSTRDEWLSARSEVVVPAGRMIDQRIASVEAQIADLQRQREKIVEDTEAEFKRKRTPKAKRADLLDDAVWSTDHAIKSERAFLDELREMAATPRDELPESSRFLLNEVPAKLRYTYRKDEHGRLMPPEEYERYLDSVLSVGEALHDDLGAAFQADSELSRLRENLANADAADKAVALRAVAQRESELTHALLRDVRQMGGSVPAHLGSPSGVKLAAPPNWKEQLDEAFRYFPTDWLARMADSPLEVVGSERAFYASGVGDWPDLMALSTLNLDYHGAFSGYAEEVAAHELGHRMEQYVPGLQELEYTLVRRRAVENGTLNAPKNMADLVDGYNHADNEMTYEDRWPNPYTGKTYESGMPDDPAAVSSEAFQVGLQDVFGRGVYRYGDRELSSFVLAVLALL